jgi:hypothetical protein
MMARCHPQDQSPLFQLPGEIRNVIYYFTFTGGDSYSEELSTKERFRPRTHQSRRLLSTCRRVYLEAKGMAVEQSTLVVRNGLDIQDKMAKVDSQQIGHVLMYCSLQSNVRPDLLLAWISRYCSPQHVTVRLKDKFQNACKILGDMSKMLDQEKEIAFTKRLESFTLEIYPSLNNLEECQHWLEDNFLPGSRPVKFRRQIWQYKEGRSQVSILRVEIIQDKNPRSRVSRVAGMPGMSYFILDGADKLWDSDSMMTEINK